MQKKIYHIVKPSNFKLDGGAMFGIIPKPLWNKVHPADSENRIDLAMRLMLIQTNNRAVLIDTGIGDYHDQKFNDRFQISNTTKPLLSAIQQLQIEITDIVISHLHFDHVGGLGDSNNFPLFPNATLHLHRSHFEYAKNPTQRDQGSFQSEYFLSVINNTKKIHWVDGKEGIIIPEINLKFKTSMGHTPYLMHPYDEYFIYMADLVPTINHIKIPWVMGYDISPGETTKDKAALYPFIFEKKLRMIFEHDPLYNSCLLDEKFNPISLE